MNKVIKIILFLAPLLLSVHIYGHEQSTARISLVETTKDLSYRYQIQWQVSLKDLNRVIDIDDNKDLTIIGKEINANTDKLIVQMNNSIYLNDQQGSCYVEPNEANRKNLISQKSFSTGIAIILKQNRICSGGVEKFTYEFLRDIDLLHAAQLTFNSQKEQSIFLLTHKENSINFEGSNLENENKNGFYEYVRQGILHIWIGLDHLFFLCILLLSAWSLIANGAPSCEESRAEYRQARYKLLFYITAFTIAHTATLIMASMKLIILSLRIVESVIALSVAWGALELLRKSDAISTATVFNFGLIHGLGFANVLSDLTGDISSNIVLLLGFNLGVEVGQIAFLAIVY